MPCIVHTDRSGACQAQMLWIQLRGSLQLTPGTLTAHTTYTNDKYTVLSVLRIWRRLRGWGPRSRQTRKPKHDWCPVKREPCVDKLTATSHVLSLFDMLFHYTHTHIVHAQSKCNLSKLSLFRCLGRTRVEGFCGLTCFRERLT